MAHVFYHTGMDVMSIPTRMYFEIERRAGGLGQPHKAWIKAIHSMLKPESKTRVARDMRHEIIRDVLDMRDVNLQQFVDWRF